LIAINGTATPLRQPLFTVVLFFVILNLLKYAYHQIGEKSLKKIGKKKGSKREEKRNAS